MKLLYAGAIFAAVVVLAVVISMIGRQAADNAGPAPNPSASPTLQPASPHPTSVLTAEGPGPTPSSSDASGDSDAGQDGGSDTHVDEVPPAVKIAARQTSTRFWRAFSERDPKRRTEALKQVAAPDLVKRMAVANTSRIPVVKPSRAVVLDGSFNSALVVTQDESSQWWFVDVIQDPMSEKWAVQRYEQASQQMITDATQLLDHPSSTPSPTRK